MYCRSSFLHLFKLQFVEMLRKTISVTFLSLNKKVTKEISSRGC